MIYVLFDLIFTISVYLFFPVGYRLVLGKVPYTKGNRIALVNAIIGASFFIFLRLIITHGEIGVRTFAPALLYYNISRVILIDRNLPDPESKKKKNQNEEELGEEELGEEEFNENVETTETSTDELKDNITNEVGNEEISESEDQCCFEEDYEEDYEDEFDDYETDDDEDEYDEIMDDEDSDENESSNLTKTQNVFVKSIKRLQTTATVIIFLLLSFVVLYPLSVVDSANKNLPDIELAKEVRLSSLDSNTQVYCNMIDDINYIYLKDDIGEIKIYKFQNESSRFSSGYATSIELKNYFDENLHKGKPPISFIMPEALPIGLTVSLVSLFIIVIILIVIHRKAKELIFKLTKEHKYFIAIKKMYKENEISSYEYKRKLKKMLSLKILENSKILKLFKFIY